MTKISFKYNTNTFDSTRINRNVERMRGKKDVTYTEKIERRKADKLENAFE